MATPAEHVREAWLRCGLSGWIVGGHPVREGLYQVRVHKDGAWAWCYFSLGHTWGWMDGTPEGAMKLSRRPNMIRIHSFRGLAKDPAATITGGIAVGTDSGSEADS